MRLFTRVHLGLPAVALLVCAMLLAAVPVSASGNPNPGILPPNAQSFGTSYGEWAAAWWNWALSGPKGSNVLEDTTGANCGLNQAGPVWFLAGALNSGAAERTCAIPTGEALFFPVANYFLSAEAPTYQETLDKAQAYWRENFVSASATIDGREVADLLTNYYVTSPDFGLVLPDNNIFDVPAGTYSPSVAIGYHLMVAPLPPGSHEIHVQAQFKDSGLIDVTYHLTVGK